MEHYLDNSATTKVCDEAAQAALKAMTEVYGNPSSTHLKGREAKKMLDKARKQVADALGCSVDELIFTSCGSESDNMAILCGAEAMKRKGKHIISSAVEHSAVRKAYEKLEEQGFEVTRLAPDSKGVISVEAVLEALREDTILVSLMMVNNETGAITDISAISKALKKAGSQALVHTDAVQAFLKVPFSAKPLGADMISISGHKIHAPKGIGALYIKSGLKLKPIILGGSQEYGLRAGTESMPLIASLGAACEVGYKNIKANIAHMAELKAYTIEKLTAAIPELRYLDTEASHILSVSMPGWRSEVLMNFLEAKEIYVSKSSACKKGQRSQVLEAMGLDAKAIDGAIRVGFCRYNTKEDIDALCLGLKEARDTLAHS